MARNLLIALIRLFNRAILLPILYAVEPFWKIRVTHINTARIGHLAVNTGFFLSRLRRSGAESGTWRLLYGYRPCNETLFELFRRELPIVKSRALSRWYNIDIDFLSRTPFFATLPFFSNEFLDAEKAPVLRFSDEEEEKGKALLRSMGIGPDDWFMCFHTRDSAYHRRRVGIDEAKPHRNAEIETYLDAARLVVERGGIAIRVGSDVERPVGDPGSTRIVDYASNYRSDFGDIYLLAKCRFFLSGATGMGFVPPLFDVPVILTNFLPPPPWPVRRQSMFMPKLLRHASTGQLLTFREMASYGMFDYPTTKETLRRWVHKWDHPDTYKQMGLEVVDNEAADLLGATLDMLDQIDGRPPSEEAIRLQRLFTDGIMAEVPDYAAYGPRLPPRLAVKYRALIEN